jgi:hypothetical protein
VSRARFESRSPPLLSGERKYGLTNYTELGPSETATCSVTQEFLNILWYPKVHCRVHKSPPLVPILGQINSVHSTPSYYSKIRFNIILHLCLCLPSGLLPFGFPIKTLHVLLFAPCVLHALSISSESTYT